TRTGMVSTLGDHFTFHGLAKMAIRLITGADATSCSSSSNLSRQDWARQHHPETSRRRPPRELRYCKGCQVSRPITFRSLDNLCTSPPLTMPARFQSVRPCAIQAQTVPLANNWPSRLGTLLLPHPT